MTDDENIKCPYCGMKAVIVIEDERKLTLCEQSHCWQIIEPIKKEIED